MSAKSKPSPKGGASAAISMRVLVLLLALLGISLTPYFLVAVIVAIVLQATLRPLRNQFFDSFFTRFVVQFLVFCGFSMIVAMFCWLGKIEVLPAYVLAPYLILYAIFHRFFPPGQATANKWFSRDDALSSALALVGIVLLLGSFYLPKPSLASSIQIITNGYDNTSHLSLIQTTYNDHGYLYGSYANIKHQVSWASQIAYPQGWHFANAYLWHGISSHIFDGGDMSLRINLYVATVVIWYFIMVFLFTRLSLYVVRLYGLGREVGKLGGMTAFVSVNLLMQLLIFWGIWNYGFVTFISALVYSLVLIGGLLTSNEERGKYRLFCYLLCLLSATAISLSWLFPTPLVLAMIVLVFGGSLYKLPIKKVRAFMRRRLFLGYVVGSVILVLPILAQIGINLAYSTEGSGQVNDDGGIFGISSLLVLVVLLFVSYFAMTAGRGVPAYLKNVYVTVAAPALLFTGLVYVYQMFSVGHNSYFYTKSIALVTVYVGVFLGAAFIKVISSLNFPQWPQLYMAIVAISAVASLVMFAGQTTATFNSLFQRNSNVSYQVASATAKLARNGTLVKGHTLILAGSNYVGTIFTVTSSHRVDQCAADGLWVEITARNNLLPYYMEVCAKEGKSMNVITIPSTYNAIAGLHNPRIHAILAK